jgi:hypothetical protein
VIIKCSDVLEIHHAAGVQEAKAAMRMLARRYHPDAMKGHEFYRQEKMKLINVAYQGFMSGYMSVEIDDSWSDSLSLLEESLRVVQEYRGLLESLGGAPRGSSEEAIAAMRRLADGLQEFLDQGEAVPGQEGPERLSAMMEETRRRHEEWERRSLKRMQLLAAEASAEMRKGKASRASIEKEGLSGFLPNGADLVRAEDALAAAIASGDEERIRASLSSYRSKLSELMVWAERARNGLAAAQKELEDIFARGGGEYAVRHALRNASETAAAKDVEMAKDALARHDLAAARLRLDSIADALDRAERRRAALAAARDEVAAECARTLWALDEMRSLGIDLGERSMRGLEEMCRSTADEARRLNEDAAILRLKTIVDSYRSMCLGSDAWCRRLAEAREARADAAVELRTAMGRVGVDPGSEEWLPASQACGLSDQSEGPDDVLAAQRALSAIQDVQRTVHALSAALAEAEDCARSLFEMAVEGFAISPEERSKVKLVRSRMAACAQKGDAIGMVEWLSRLQGVRGTNQPRYAEHREAWSRLQGRRDAVLAELRRILDALVEDAHARASFERAAARLEKAFGTWDRPAAETELLDLEKLAADLRPRSDIRERLRREAREAIATAEERLRATQCTCCWASPSERRKAAARIETLCRLQSSGNVVLLTAAVKDMRAFIDEHDAGHDQRQELAMITLEAMHVSSALRSASPGRALPSKEAVELEAALEVAGRTETAEGAAEALARLKRAVACLRTEMPRDMVDELDMGVACRGHG